MKKFIIFTAIFCLNSIVFAARHKFIVHERRDSKRDERMERMQKKLEAKDDVPLSTGASPSLIDTQKSDKLEQTMQKMPGGTRIVKALSDIRKS